MFVLFLQQLLRMLHQVSMRNEMLELVPPLSLSCLSCNSSSSSQYRLAH